MRRIGDQALIPRVARWLSIGALSLAMALVGAGIGCSGQTVIGRDTDAPDAAPSKCGDRTCPTGERCCFESATDCAPRCLAVSACPVDVPLPPRCPERLPPLRWFSTCPEPGCVPGPPPTPCPPDGSPCDIPNQKCGVPSPATCGVIFVCMDSDPKPRDCPR